MLKDDIMYIMEKYEHSHDGTGYVRYSVDSEEYPIVADEIVDLVLKKIMDIRKEVPNEG